MENKRAFGQIELCKGILFLCLGIIILFIPELALSGVSVVLGIIILALGIIGLVMYYRASKVHAQSGPVAYLVMGIVSVLAGLLLIANPVLGRGILSVAFSLWFIFYFTLRVIAYESIKHIVGKAASTLVLCLSVFGLLFSAVMLFNPMLFTISVGVLIAVNLIIIGINSIADALGGWKRNSSHASGAQSPTPRHEYK